MSYALQMAGKIALVVALVAVINVVLGALLGSVLALFSVNTTIPTLVAEWLNVGRELANIFVPAQLFNACITVWFLGLEAVLGWYVYVFVVRKFFLEG